LPLPYPHEIARNPTVERATVKMTFDAIGYNLFMQPTRYKYNQQKGCLAVAIEKTQKENEEIG
jgi:hypothetical protein